MGAHSFPDATVRKLSFAVMKESQEYSVPGDDHASILSARQMLARCHDKVLCRAGKGLITGQRGSGTGNGKPGQAMSRNASNQKLHHVRTFSCGHPFTLNSKATVLRERHTRALEASVDSAETSLGGHPGGQPSGVRVWRDQRDSSTCSLRPGETQAPETSSRSAV